MEDDELHYLELHEAARRIVSRQTSSETLTRALLERVQRFSDLGAYIQVLDEQALASACQADDELARGLCRGALHGVPIAVKDIFRIKGQPVSAGM
jgi:amidase